MKEFFKKFIEGLKAYFKANKKKCITAIIVAIAAIIFSVSGQSIPVDAIVDKICSIFGGC